MPAPLAIVGVVTAIFAFIGKIIDFVYTHRKVVMVSLAVVASVTFMTVLGAELNKHVVSLCQKIGLYGKTSSIPVFEFAKNINYIVPFSEIINLIIVYTTFKISGMAFIVTITTARWIYNLTQKALAVG